MISVFRDPKSVSTSTLRAMIRLPEALKTAGLKTEMLLHVHDELVFEAPDDEVNETEIIVRKVMEAAVQLDVPMIVDVGHAQTWGSAH